MQTVDISPGVGLLAFLVVFWFSWVHPPRPPRNTGGK